MAEIGAQLRTESLRTLIEQYDLAAPVTPFALSQGVNNPTFGIHTATADYALKIHPSYAALDAIEYEHALVRWLAGQNLSFDLPLPLQTRVGDWVCSIAEGWATLVPLLPGQAPEFRLVNGQRHPRIHGHAALLGSALGELHTAIRRYPALPRPGRALFQLFFQFPQSNIDPLTLAPKDLGLAPASPAAPLLRWWREEAGMLQRFLQTQYPLLPQHICHNDYAAPNILLHNDRVSAILDFEFAAPAARALDVAMALRMCMQIEAENPEPWEVTRCFRQAYAQWIRLTDPEIRALPLLIRLRTALPLAWALRRPVPVGAENILLALGRMQRTARWLARHERQFHSLLHG